MSYFASLMLQGIVVVAVLTVVGQLLGKLLIRDYGEEYRYDDIDPKIDLDEFLATHSQDGKK